jgi:hypothetical protein
MLTAYTMALPPSALPPIDGVIATAGLALLFAVLLAALAAFAGVLLQSALATPARRPAVRIVERPATESSRDAA